MLRLALALLLAAPACAQPAPKPSATPDPRARRADSVVSRPGRPAESAGPAAGPAAGAPQAAPADTAVTVRTVGLRVGETPVEVRVSERPCPRACGSAVVVHDDEDTAVEAALAVLGRRGGRLVELRHAGTRNLTFSLGGEAFTVDPNRIFTDAGRARTLAALSRDAPAARAAVAAFADALLGLVGTPAGPGSGPGRAVVALHNNTEANYSAASYAPGGSDAREAAAVHLQPGADPDDFVFVTTRPLFDAVVASGANAVLQDNAAATDDGSLSVWAAQRGRPYVNVEAQHGHLAEQVRLVEALRGWTGEE